MTSAGSPVCSSREPGRCALREGIANLRRVRSHMRESGTRLRQTRCMSTEDTPQYDYDVAVSFAGEDRGYVEEVVRSLQAAHVNVFYDQDQLAAMWGENLVDFLQAIYKRRARFAIIFISRHYVAKTWPGHERQSAQDRALQQSSPYILPIRLDDTELPGLHATISYLDSRTVGIEGVVSAIKQKLGSSYGSVVPRFDGKVPRTSEGVAALLGERPGGWEYLLYAGMLRQGIDDLNGKYQDYVIGYAKRSGNHLRDDQVSEVLQNSIASVSSISESFDRVLASGPQEAAFGKPGESGDPERIIHLAARFVSVYEEFIDWATDLRAMSVSDGNLRRVLDLESRFVENPLKAMRDFVDKFVAEADTLVARLLAGEKIDLSMVVKLEVGDEITSGHREALRRYYSSRS